MTTMNGVLGDVKAVGIMSLSSCNPYFLLVATDPRSILGIRMVHKDKEGERHMLKKSARSAKYFDLSIS